MKKGYVYFIEGDRGLMKIGYTVNPARRFQAHRAGLRKMLGKVRFTGCVEGTLADEQLALSYFRPAAGHEIRHGNSTPIEDIFPGRPVIPISHFVPYRRESLKPKTTLIGRRVRSDRKAAKLTLRDLERLSGVSNCYISQIENGRVRDITTGVCAKLAKGLKCDPAWLAGWDGAPKGKRAA